jgi:DivIVA domain-containing protein
MTDDAFHLTPLDVRRFEFPTTLRGYDKARVDSFRDQVAEEMERLTRLLQEMEMKAKSFHEQLRAFRERDKALNDALVSAQQLRGEMKEQAEKEAELIIRQAHADAERILDGARNDARGITAEMDALERSRRAYLAQLRSLTERQLAEIEAAQQTSPIPRTPPSSQPVQNLDTAAAHATPVWLKSLVEE